MWPLLELLTKIRWVLACSGARKIFATARKLGFSLKCARFSYGKAYTRYEYFWKHASLFCWRFSIETDKRINKKSSRKAPAKIESNLEPWKILLSVKNDHRS